MLDTWREKAFPMISSGTGRSIWIHVAGYGDAMAGLAFLRTLYELHPQALVHVTYTTCSARAFVMESVVGIPSVCGHSWLPFAFPSPIKSFLAQLRPCIFINMQGEFWPCLIETLRKMQIPSICLRVDMFDWDSQSEFPWYLKSLYMGMLQDVSNFSARSPEHRENLLRLGVAPDKVIVGGDYRLECFPDVEDDQCTRMRSLLGIRESDILVVWAAPRMDEIKELLPSIDRVRREIELRLVIAPAGLDILIQCEKLLQSLDILHWRRSTHPESSICREQVILLDTSGELFHLYGIASATIVGDTFPPVYGMGRNFWEPIRQGCPIICGVGMQQTLAVSDLESLGWLCQVARSEQLVERLRAARVLSTEKRNAIRDYCEGLHMEVKASMIDASLLSANNLGSDVLR